MVIKEPSQILLTLYSCIYYWIYKVEGFQKRALCLLYDNSHVSYEELLAKEENSTMTLN